MKYNMIQSTEIDSMKGYRYEIQYDTKYWNRQ